MGVAGFAMQGPIVHGLYTSADRLFGTGAPKFGIVLRKVAFMSACAPIHITAVFGTVALLSGKSSAEAIEKVSQDLPKAYIPGFAYWPAVNLAAFGLIQGVEARGKLYAVAGLIWSVFLAYCANIPVEEEQQSLSSWLSSTMPGGGSASRE